jgi:hypothetical protein
MGALTKCNDCGHEVSKSADSCPNCGARFKLCWYEGRWSNVLKLILIVLLLFVIVPILLGG